MYRIRELRTIKGRTDYQSLEVEKEEKLAGGKTFAKMSMEVSEIIQSMTVLNVMKMEIFGRCRMGW